MEATESRWEWREHNRTKVLKCIQDGEYEAIVTSGQSELDVLAHLAAELGILEAVKLIEVKRERAGIPDELLLRTLAVLPFVEALGLSASANTLFEDAAILIQLGYTMVQLQEGFNDRHGAKLAEKSHDSVPMHPDVLRQELQRIEPASLDTFRQYCVGQLYARGLIKGNTYAIDGSGLSNRWRVVGLLCISGGLPFWVTWRLLPGDASEKGKEGTVLFEMVDEIRDLAGEKAIKWVWEPERWQSPRLDVRYVAGRKQLRLVSIGVVGDDLPYKKRPNKRDIVGNSPFGAVRFM